MKRIQELEDEIKILIRILKYFQQAYRDKFVVKIRRLTANELLNWCGDTQSAIKGKNSKS
ncbi:MAG: hypothetical protein CMK59_09965 [Proteobacteria bacterium]|nr:hypothetical protein [Pseudomonadota bacterium]